jgi:hypothetical protein
VRVSVDLHGQVVDAVQRLDGLDVAGGRLNIHLPPPSPGGGLDQHGGRVLAGQKHLVLVQLGDRCSVVQVEEHERFLRDRKALEDVAHDLELRVLALAGFHPVPAVDDEVSNDSTDVPATGHGDDAQGVFVEVALDGGHLVGVQPVTLNPGVHLKL